LTPFGLETWRGAVRPAHIDEMGHMNVRFYVAIAMESLASLACALGMPRAFTAGAGATLMVREHHIRFLKEARVGTGLHMRCAVLSMGETDAQLLQVLFHSATGEPAAALLTRVEHTTQREQRAFPWPASARKRAEGLMAAAPAYALPRGIAHGPVHSRASQAEAERLGVPVVASGALKFEDCDVFGRMHPEHLLERISAGMPHMRSPASLILDDALADLQGRLGSATVEFRAIYHRWPKAGDLLTLNAGLASLTPKMRTLIHWLVDPASGQAWASAEMITLFFDLEARKAMALPQAVLDVMAAQVIEGLAL
jgi:acyl-CoA thioester hydrolase